MNLCRQSLLAASVLAVWVPARPGLAQTDPTRLAQVSMANQTGVMEYCGSKGWADQAAIDAQKKAAASLPATTDQSGLSEAEATGRQGNLMNNGTSVSLSSMAAKGNTTEQDLCGRMASAAKTAAAQRSSMQGFPTMPGGAAMPHLPAGMTMPSVPGMSMPSMPGMPKPQ